VRGDRLRTAVRGGGVVHRPLHPRHPGPAARRADEESRELAYLGNRVRVQTTFTAEQLADPDVAESEKILRKCVHCGFCTATCPTYVTLGNELDSPRGRIYLIKDMLENGRPADKQIVTHIDRCL